MSAKPNAMRAAGNADRRFSRQIPRLQKQDADPQVFPAPFSGRRRSPGRAHEDARPRRSVRADGHQPELAELNWQRYASWETPFSLRNARQAVFAFRGDVYLGLQAEQFGTAELNFAQKHLRILSGLYGLLRPLDLIQPYRLEMGRQVAVDGYSGLYDFWGSRLAETLNEDLAAQPQKRKLLVNLASNEYFESVDTEALEADVITPVFKDQTTRGDYRVLSFLAKRARGKWPPGSSGIASTRATR